MYPNEQAAVEKLRQSIQNVREQVEDYIFERLKPERVQTEQPLTAQPTAADVRE